MRSLILNHILALSFLFVLVAPIDARAEMDPRAKALASMSLYGVIGGTLLGVAVQAFDVSDSLGRSMAKGASLGLYTGILFGSYVVLSHYYRTKALSQPPSDDPDNYYPEEGGSPYESGGGGGYDQRWRSDWDMEDLKVNDFKLKSIQKGTQKESPVFYLNLMNIRF